MKPELFYGLNQMPFLKKSSYGDLYETEDIRQIRDRLEYLREIRGIGLFTGNPGTGKTAALRTFVQNLNPSLYKVVYLHLTTVSPAEFMRQLAAELGLEPLHRKTDLFRSIQEEIRYLVSEKRCVPVIILDEAQHLSNSILRDLVMLLNFDMDSKDYCILVLTGLNSLNRSLKLAINEPLRQRIVVNYHMGGLDRQEAENYISFCLEKCGSREPVFSEDAIEAAWRSCHGSVRILNSLLSRSMIEGANRRQRLIDSEIISLAHSDNEIDA